MAGRAVAEVSDPSPEPPQPVRKGPVEPPVIALVVGVGVLIYVACLWLGKGYATPLFLGGPLLLGLTSGLASARRPYWNVTFGLLAGLLLAISMLREGVTCVVMALPLILPFALLGALLGRLIRERVSSRRRRKQIGLFTLLLVLCWQAVEGQFDDPKQHPVQRADAATEIAAPPSVVFAALTLHPLEVPQRWQWFLKLGLPMARRIEVLEPRVGGEIRMEQNFGVVHARITELDPGRAFAFVVERYEVKDAPFHITRLGRGSSYGLRAERVEDWLTILSVRYTFEPTAEGRTRLSRAMVWRRHLTPDFYFGLLQQAVIGRGQQRLLALIRETVEQRELHGSEGTVAAREPGSR